MPYESTHISNNHIPILLSYNVQHLNKLLYQIMVDTSSKYKKEQFNFPLRENFFCTSPAPPPPDKFSNGQSLTSCRLQCVLLLCESPL